MRYLFFLLVLLFAACGNEPEALQKPDDLIPEEKMVNVLADVHLLEAALTLRQPSLRQPMIMRADPSIVQAPAGGGKSLQYYDIFKKHELTREQYEKAMLWYTSHPEELNLIYDKVLVELTRRQAEQQAGK